MAKSKRDYSSKLDDPRWKQRRDRERQRACWACEWCSAVAEPLHVHHWAYEGDPWDAPEGTLTVLCKAHHEVADEIRTLARRLTGHLLAKPSNLYRGNPEDALAALRRLAEETDAAGFIGWLSHWYGGWGLIEASVIREHLEALSTFAELGDSEGE